MSDRLQDGYQEAEDALQQALLRLTSPPARELQRELDSLRVQIASLRELEGEDAAGLQKKLEETNLILDSLERKFLLLSVELRDPAMIGQRLEDTLVPTLHRQVLQREDDVAEVLAPVMGPAIRRQIRDAKEDIIDALYPLIGQIIGKAISESFRELTHSIDTRLRQQLNFRDRLDQAMARLRGVSNAELILRGALPYSIERVFLVHRETGLLLSHISAQAEERRDMDTISGMLTAIQDFVRDSFSGGEGELEEITHGGRRILLESGQRAYVAVVLRGVEPVGYHERIHEASSEIHLRYEGALKQFDGDMERLPDFKPVLALLLAPPPAPAVEWEASKPLSGTQKRVVGITLTGLLLLIGMTIFGCVFVTRLWPLAFPPAPLPMPTATVTPSPSPTATQTLTLTPSSTPTLVPTDTSTLAPTKTPLPVGILTGNLNVRTAPTRQAPVVGVIPAGEKVIVVNSQDGWHQVVWPAQGDPQLEGWVWGEYLELSP
jgi:hypothetical protein